jgi:acyl carrier protein
VVFEVIGDDEIHADMPLMEAGMDSLASIEFWNELQASLRIKLPSVLIFDHPTTATVVTAAWEMMADRQQPVDDLLFRNEASEFMRSDPLNDGVCNGSDGEGLVGGYIDIVETTCRFPDAGDVAGFLPNVSTSGTDSMVRAPFSRWDMDDIYEPYPCAAGRSYA